MIYPNNPTTTTSPLLVSNSRQRREAELTERSNNSLWNVLKNTPKLVVLKQSQYIDKHFNYSMLRMSHIQFIHTVVMSRSFNTLTCILSVAAYYICACV